ncbi:846_t:CDS:2 [Cetraspora pellucida]|uniref:846_t:CDS:1 n=1 Tax=Cetraspora pellucida TaxID=1433469 RepID=A0A9N9EHS0_9GLOM|nr:846_t:CDS:2 [Cetraspora pellucida]
MGLFEDNTSTNWILAFYRHLLYVNELEQSLHTGKLVMFRGLQLNRCNVLQTMRMELNNKVVNKSKERCKLVNSKFEEKK